MINPQTFLFYLRRIFDSEKFITKTLFMKQKLTMFVATLILATGAFAQKKATKDFTSNKKGQLFGIHFSVSDFTTPETFKTSPNAISQSERKFPNIKDMSFGLGFSYWKGLTPKIDFAATLNTVFHDYSSLYAGTTGTNEVGVELEPTFNIRPIADNNRWAPFLTVGIGGGLYSNKIGAYAPVGGGVQFNMASTTYFFAKMQYHFAITTDVLKDNLFYSVGFAESFGAPKPVPVVIPVIPVVEAPKDRDGDGVLDADDKCPDTKGLASLQGCPDRDGDGIADGDDSCPDVKGTAKYKGCPIPDTDGDGINDENDKCVTVPGVARYQGCPVPDTDGDGVNDEEDKCPTEKGLRENNGCPKLEDFAFQANNVQFLTGSAILTKKAKLELDKGAAILNEHNTLKIAINGYADNTGKPATNLALSHKRAAAVKAYLESKGVPADRLTSEGYGSANPIADNKTAAGRAKNRRVEFKTNN